MDVEYEWMFRKLPPNGAMISGMSRHRHAATEEIREYLYAVYFRGDQSENSRTRTRGSTVPATSWRLTTTPRLSDPSEAIDSEKFLLEHLEETYHKSLEGCF
ncbi:hypothetical protein TNCV_1355371 [Trichonephila clavipes]|uniref:Uncharacterized protein n=1 Tax=Trichonephila clavipes TaxID=2585209 RepID=A0A8X6VI36_TRICX|nr:hypothetical protein TNCV_1355371 [Trichonephila clavipes]